jgi:hypothetical protein
MSKEAWFWIFKTPQIARQPASADSPADHHKTRSTFLKVPPIVLLQIFLWVLWDLTPATVCRHQLCGKEKKILTSP